MGHLWLIWQNTFQPLKVHSFLFWFSVSGPSISFSILCALSLISSPSNVLEGLVDVCGHANMFCRGFLAWCFSSLVLCNSAQSSLNGPSWLFHYPKSYLQCWKCWTTPDEIWLELARHTVFLNHKCENYCMVCLSDVKGCGFFFSPAGLLPNLHSWSSSLMLLSMDYLQQRCRLSRIQFHHISVFTLDFVLHSLPFGMHWIHMRTKFGDLHICR